MRKLFLYSLIALLALGTAACLDEDKSDTKDSYVDTEPKEELVEEKVEVETEVEELPVEVEVEEVE